MKKLKAFLLLSVMFVATLCGADIKSTTVITDPVGNTTTTIYFGPYPFSVVEKKGGSTLLSTTEMCYNGGSYPCAAALVTPPLTQKDIYTTITGITGPSRVMTTYNTYGLPTDTKLYDFGPTLVSEQVVTYATLGDPTIKAAISDVTTKDHTGTKVAQYTATYDGDGNTLTRNMLVTGSTFLTETLTYTSKGMIATSTGVNGAQTVYSNSKCNGFEPGSITFPLTGTESINWNCNGAVPTSITDVNGKTYTAAYADPLFRPTSGTDALGVSTTYAYTANTYQVTGPASQSVITYNGSGKPIVSQVKNGGSYDTNSQDFDPLGRKISSSLPCDSGRSKPCSTTQITASYDSGSVPTTTLSDGLGGVISTSYSKGDKKITISPAPTGEAVKSKQYEYDGLGRLTSVCEISSGAGSGSCGQRVSAVGFLTAYTYDDLGNVLTITQGAQTRTLTYDDLGRVLTSMQPESGTTTYTYDTTASCGGTTANGSLVKKVDANGNTSCYKYDSASRMTSVTYSGPNATDDTYYVYDTATVNGVSMQNGKGRLVETYTCTSCPGTKKTDVGFSYDAVGQITDAYESTTNSGGYYHLALSHYNNQVLSAFTLTPAVIPTISYGVDGEGRTSSVQAGTSTLVNSTSRGPGNQITQITYGTGDSDVFGYDSNLRMTQFAFSLGGNSITGDLTYNQNGTVASRKIKDPFQTSTNETCAYTYDFWARMSTANCNNFTEAFGYDRYGNMTKTGTTSFTPTYSATTNRMTAIGVVTPTYDDDGNILSDGTSTYTWDAEGRMLSGPGIDSVMYNGFGQMAEQTRGSAHQQLVYFPSGELLALMTGQSLNYAYVPMPTGGPAVYNADGLLYYTHPDNTGSVRVTITPARTLFSDLSYTPFGEKYNDSVAPGVISSVLYFAGHNQTTVAGLYDTPTRKYNPLQGRWVSADINGNPRGGDPQTFNLYAYATNRPFDLLDSTGRADDLAYNAIPELGTGAPAQDPSSYDPYGFLNADSVTPLVYNGGSPAGGAGGSYSTTSIILDTLGKIDPIGLSAGELEAVPEYLSYASKMARGAFVGPYEGHALMQARIARELQYYTGNGRTSLRDVQNITSTVLDGYGSLFKGPMLAAGLTNPGMTREEVAVAIQESGGRFNYKSGLNAWAESIGAKTYSSFEADYTNGLRDGLSSIFDGVARDGGTIHFNLDGLEDIPAAVAGKSKGGTLVQSWDTDIFGRPRMVKVLFNNSVTVYELRYLKQNWTKFEPITFFYREGRMVIDAAPGGQSYVPW